MIFIGIDVSKDVLDGVRVNRAGKPLASFAVPNTAPGIAAFLDGIRDRSQSVTIAAESTGEFHRLIAIACLERGIRFRLLNPIVVKQFTRATVRKKKTDPADALSIAKLALQGEGQLITGTFYPTVTLVSRTANRLGRVAQVLHLMDRRLERHFPAETELRQQIQRLHDATMRTIGTVQEQAIGAADPALRVLLASIPGIGPMIATTLLAEIQDVHRFPDGKTLVAYAGLDPRVRQSGHTLKRNTRLTKRGSPYLRRSLFIAASIAQRHDPELKAYFERKVREGKRYKEATVAVARKLLYRVHAVWKRGTPYVPAKLST